MSYKKGESGNLNGRPSGRTAAAKFRKAIEERMPDILDAMITQALDGDVAAQKVLVDKIIPGLKNQSATVQITAGNTLAESGSNVVNAGMDGSIAPDTSALLLNALSSQARILEVTELEQRINVLEGNT